MVSQTVEVFTKYQVGESIRGEWEGERKKEAEGGAWERGSEDAGKEVTFKVSDS